MVDQRWTTVSQLIYAAREFLIYSKICSTALKFKYVIYNHLQIIVNYIFIFI